MRIRCQDGNFDALRSHPARHLVNVGLNTTHEREVVRRHLKHAKLSGAPVGGFRSPVAAGTISLSATCAFGNSGSLFMRAALGFARDESRPFRASLSHASDPGPTSDARSHVDTPLRLVGSDSIRKRSRSRRSAQSGCSRHPRWHSAPAPRGRRPGSHQRSRNHQARLPSQLCPRPSRLLSRRMRGHQATPTLSPPTTSNPRMPVPPPDRPADRRRYARADWRVGFDNGQRRARLRQEVLPVLLGAA